MGLNEEENIEQHQTKNIDNGLGNMLARMCVLNG